MKRKSIIRLTVVCAFSLALTMSVAFGVQAKGTAEGSGLGQITEQAKADDDSFAPEKGFKMKTRSNLPSYFDLRNVGAEHENYITNVKEQTPFGTCWGFGAISAAESSLLSSGIAEKVGYAVTADPDSGKDALDLSEKQIAWYYANPISDKSNPQNGEGTKFGETENASFTDKVIEKYNAGGATSVATNMFAMGCGPSDENPRDKNLKDELGTIFQYHGKNGEKKFDEVTLNEGDENKVWKAVCYSDKDDWTMPEELRFTKSYSLEDSVILPKPMLSEENEGGDEDSEYNWTLDPNKLDAIKTQLVDGKRAVAVSFCADSYNPNQEMTRNYMSEHWAQYTYSDYTSANHVVTIVGYDDNYPKENFVKGHQPENDGAWLIKNSWGSDLEPFPNNSYRHFGTVEGQDTIPYSDATMPQPGEPEKHTGYFWLSYYDKSVDLLEAYKFIDYGDEEDSKEAIEKEVIDQHDYMPVSEYEDFKTDSESKMANVFTAKSAQQLTHVGYFTTTPGTKVSFKVYLLTSGSADPQDGELVYSSDSREHSYGGFHRVALTEPASGSQVFIAKGQKYSVVVTQKTPAGKYSVSCPEAESEYKSSHNRWFDAVVNKGESYLYVDGKWNDLTDKKVQNAIKGFSKLMSVDNFTIKGYSVRQDLTLDVTDQYGEDLNGMLSIKPGSKTTVKASLRGTGEVSEPLEIKWESTNPEAFTVERTGTKVNVTAVDPGEGYLIVDAGRYGKIIIKVVSKYQMESAGFDIEPRKEKTFVYTGKPIEPALDYVRAETKVENVFNDSIVPGKDYTLKYKNNVKCGRADITAAGCGDYTGVLHSNALNVMFFIIVPEKAKIYKTACSGSQINVSFKSQKSSGISGYILSYKENGSSKVKTMKLAADKNSAVIKGITRGKTYDIGLKAYVTASVYDELYDAVNKDFFGEEDHVKAVPEKNDISFSKLRLCQAKAKKKSITIRWNQQKGANGYIVYGARAGKGSFKKLASLSAAKKSWTHKRLKKGKYYKYRVVAYKNVSNKKQKITTSKTIYVATKGRKAGNCKAIRLSKKKITLKEGKTIRLKVKTKKTGKKIKNYRKTAFESSDTNVASVNKKGVIKAVKKGSCYVYAYAQNGRYKSVKVTVK